ncbi:Putative NTF2-like domain superfamily protein [Septoria linicola]|uniref:NTF2-like domain superfamily protein n=1 Tax=Septoria linicola TaxID=215465 RepID=A0A9Q9AS02_9PEZI|nr:putative NTF2-like domain superfamily protein [Septoria linicola]USW50982.1 Putative NTF2-like domain superfamily protein [Septoria linicola]
MSSSKTDNDRSRIHELSEPRFIATSFTSDLLVAKNRRVIELMNERNYTSPFFDCIATDLEIDLHGHRLIGLKGFVEGYKAVADASPGLHVKITNASGIVDEALQSGTVILHVILSSYYDTTSRLATERASTILSCWTRENDRWLVYSYKMYCGIQAVP